MQQYVHFDYVIINDQFEAALSELKSIIVAKRQTQARQQARYADTINDLISE